LFEPGEAGAEIFESVLVGASDVGEAANVIGVDLELRRAGRFRKSCVNVFGLREWKKSSSRMPLL
jgi:uncharacterized metal-binding protein